MAKSNPKIVIIGAGFAGLAAAKELGETGQVTVIDPNPHFEFFPNIHELVSGLKQPQELKLDTQKIVDGQGQAFLQDRVTGLDRERQIVLTESGNEIKFDYCIVALGGVNNNHGVEGADKFGFPFKSVAQCHAIGLRLKELRQEGKPFQVTIVGGGVEGVESLGEILRKYGKVANLSLTLVEAGDQLLPGMPSGIHKEILRICRDFKVEFKFGSPVIKVGENQVELADGQQIKSDLTIWTGGVTVHPLMQAWGLAEKGAWPKVNAYLQSEKDDRVFIVGDGVNIAGGGEKQAYHANDMGVITAKNIKSLIQEKPLQRFHAQELPSLYAFGNLSCFMVFRGLALAGLPLSPLKEKIFQYNMALLQGGCDRTETLQDILFRALNGLVGLGGSLLSSPLSLFKRAKVKLL